jgi:plastocyanin
MSKLLSALLVLASTSAYADVTGSVEATPAKFLKDTIVYVKSVPNVKATATTVEIDQKGMEFIPHIALLMVGDSIKFHNNDKVDHNVMSPEGGYDLGAWGNGVTKDQPFKKEGVFSQVCKLHPEMLAYVFVGQNRFASLIGADGKFSIAGLPAGTYELDIWNPKLKAAAQKITVGADGKASVKFALTR